jgi:iron-sulfur cluster assembly protein
MKNKVLSNFVPVEISNSAMAEIKNIILNKNIPTNYGLRIGIKGAGCSGVSYLIGFDLKKEGDEEYLIEDTPVYIEKKHLMYLIGLKVDFVNDAEERGFIFVND